MPAVDGIFPNFFYKVWIDIPLILTTSLILPAMDGIYTKYLKYGLPLTLTTSLRMPSVESTFGKKIQSMNLYTSYEHLPYPVCILHQSVLYTVLLQYFT